MSTSIASATPSPAPSVCVLAGYFGRLPLYFDCFLRSCEANPTIQWVILTDDHTQWNPPSNVQIKQTTLANLQAEFSAKLGFEVCLTRSYLLCNFRPAFGVLFAELFVGFDFWGHCDLDMVFGDLRRFLTPEIFAKHDRVLQRGHLSLYRNTEAMNGYFRCLTPGAMDYREVLQNAAPVGFDEWRGIYRILRAHGVAQYEEEIIADIPGSTRWKNPRFEATELPNHPLQVFYWHRGKVFQAYYNRECGIQDREVAYIHFQKRRLPAPVFDVRQAEGFLITPHGFVPYAREHLTEDDFQRLNRAHWRPLPEIGAAYLASVRRKLRRWTGQPD